MLFVRDLWYVCACVYESSEASAYSFGLATNPNPTRARSYPLNINPKPESISGPAGSGRVADLYKGDIQNVQGKGACWTGLKTTALRLLSNWPLLWLDNVIAYETMSTPPHYCMFWVFWQHNQNTILISRENDMKSFTCGWSSQI